MGAACQVVLLACCFLLQQSTAQFLSSPILQWSYQLPGVNRSIGYGNGVIAIPGQRLVVTSNDASLHIISVKDLNSTITFEPTISNASETKPRCTSGAVLNGDYVMYAVKRVENSENSRIYAVDINSGVQRWAVNINGTIAGTPVLGVTKSRLYVAHNVDSGSIGRVSVIEISSNSAKVVATVPDSSDNGPFTPAAAVPMDSEKDAVFVAENDSNGYSNKNGKIFVVTPSASFDQLSGIGNDAYEFSLLSDFSVSSTTKPAVTSSFSLMSAGYQSSIVGYTDSRSMSSFVSGSRTDLRPDWTTSQERNPYRSDTPIYANPVLTPDESLLCGAAAGFDIFCLDVETGNTQWNQNTWGIVLSTPAVVAAPDGQQTAAFFVEREYFVMRMHDAFSGAVIFRTDCTENSELTCGTLVESDPLLTTDGNMLYIGTDDGNLMAFQVGSFATPAPSMSPSHVSSLTPTATSSVAPTQGAATNSSSSASNPTNPSPAASNSTNPSPAASPHTNSNTPAPSPLRSSTATDNPTLSSDGQGNSVGAVVGAETATSDKNNMAMSLGIVAGVLGLLCVVAFFVARRMIMNKSQIESKPTKNGKQSKKKSSLPKKKAASSRIIAEAEADEDEEAAAREKRRRWEEEKIRYEEQCRLAEQEYLNEVSPQSSPVKVKSGDASSPTPPQTRKMRRRRSSSRSVGGTPLTLESIEEIPEDFEEPVGDDESEGDLGFELSLTEKHTAPVIDLSSTFAAAANFSRTLASPVIDSRIHECEEKKDGDEPGDSDVMKTDIEEGLDLVSVPTGPAPDEKSLATSDSSGPGRISASSKKRDSPVTANLRSSPTPSDLASVDDSLYLDESTVASAETRRSVWELMAQKRDSDCPDDELSIRSPGSHYMTAAGVSRKGWSDSADGSRPLTPVSAAPAPHAEVSPKPQPKEEATMPQPQDESHSLESPSRAYTGASVRHASLRAKYLAHREEAHNSGLQAEDLSYETGLNRGRARRAQLMSNDEDNEKTPPRSSRSRNSTAKNESPSSKTGAVSDAWNSFLNELSKAENQFFNPKLPTKQRERSPSPPSPPPPPPNHSSIERGRPRERSLSPPPPPPPMRSP